MFFHSLIGDIFISIFSTPYLSQFIESLIKLINTLTAYSIISGAQTSFCKERNDLLDDQSAIVLLDFAENYSFAGNERFLNDLCERELNELNVKILRDPQ